jgi:hypothetical protein
MQPFSNGKYLKRKYRNKLRGKNDFLLFLARSTFSYTNQLIATRRRDKRAAKPIDLLTKNTNTEH